MSYEPGTNDCRVLIEAKGQIESMLLSLAKVQDTAGIREQLVGIHNQLEALHEQRRRQVAGAGN